MKVYAMKMITGEEVLARIGLDDVEFWQSQSKLSLSNPSVFVQSPQGVALMPWINTGDRDSVITVETSKIVAMVKPNKEVESAYLGAVTGIDVSAEKSQIIL